MNSRLKILLEMIAGAAGGFAAWAIVEPIPFLTNDTGRLIASSLDWWSVVLFGAIMGGCISAFIGGVDGLSSGSRKQFQRMVLIDLLVGLGGGMVGIYFGQIIYGILESLFRGGSGGGGLTAFVGSVFSRAVGWCLVGSFIGAAQGVPTGSTRKMALGTIGGLIGGFVGGTLFEFIGQLPGVGGVPSRMVGMTITGGAIGFCVGLVQDLLKQAWVVVLQGRNEGREYILDKPVSTLGRDELSDVGVFGDPTVAPHHAVISNTGGQFVIEDLEAVPAGTLVNGQRVKRQGLVDGDRIQVGVTVIAFHEKAGSAPLRRGRDVAAVPQQRAPAVPDNICAFCGQQKDLQTGSCACTPVAPVADRFGAPAGNAVSAVPPATETPVPGNPATAQKMAGARLVCVNGSLAGQVIPLIESEVTIGREAGRQGVRPDSTVSRRHAIVLFEGGQSRIRDEGSANGTYVNGVRITDHPLTPGDRIRIGASEFRFES